MKIVVKKPCREGLRACEPDSSTTNYSPTELRVTNQIHTSMTTWHIDDTNLHLANEPQEKD